jgi:hypothetical protein
MQFDRPGRTSLMKKFDIEAVPVPRLQPSADS